MIKQIICIVIFLFTSILFAQENTASPYSFYGLGENKFKNTNDMNAMGGISIYSDSIHINVNNPASYSKMLLTSLQAGFTYNSYKLNNATQSEKAKKGTFDYFTFAFPISKKSGIALGIAPQTSVGYRLSNNNTTDNVSYSRSYFGSGGANNIFLGLGYKINKNWSAGIEGKYVFGTIKSENYLFQSNAIYATSELNNTTVSAFGLKTAITFEKKINKYNFTSTIVFSPETKINSNNIRITRTLNSNNVTISEIYQDLNSKSNKLPSTLIVGAGIGTSKWFVGFDYTNRSNTALFVTDDIYTNASFKASNKVTLGGYYLPNVNSYSSYLNRIKYKAGIRYENTGLVVNNNAINEQAFSFGLEFPFKGTFSTLSIGSEIGSRGTTSNGLIKENFFSINVGLMFSDKWFRKNYIN